MWGWIKRWFDPVTVSKIFILSDHDVLPVLTTFMDLEDIPKNYGGKLQWSFFDEPAYDDEIKRIVTWENGFTNFPPGPCHWQPIEDGTRLECIAVGSKDGEERRVRVCTIPKAFPPKSDSPAEIPGTNGVKEEASTVEGEDAATEPTPKAGVTTGESTADAVTGLVITDAKDSVENLSEKIAHAVDAATETKAH